jgi:hypothetical protein
LVQEQNELLKTKPKQVSFTQNEVDKVDKVDNIHSKAPKSSPKLDLVIAHLKANPDDASLSNRKLADKLGVSQGYVGQAKRLLDV